MIVLYIWCKKNVCCDVIDVYLSFTLWVIVELVWCMWKGVMVVLSHHRGDYIFLVLWKHLRLMSASCPFTFTFQAPESASYLFQQLDWISVLIWMPVQLRDFAKRNTWKAKWWSTKIMSWREVNASLSRPQPSSVMPFITRCWHYSQASGVKNDEFPMMVMSPKKVTLRSMENHCYHNLKLTTTTQHSLLRISRFRVILWKPKRPKLS